MSNEDNVHIKRIDKAIKTMRETAELHLGGASEEKVLACADELEQTRGVLLAMFDIIDGKNPTAALFNE